jgi:hypothetical protein
MIAGLFGKSRYHTRLQLWHHFVTGASLDHHEDDRMRWGRLLQPLITAEVARREGWEIESNEADNWLEHPDSTLRTGATVDALILRHERGLGVLETKCVDRAEWQWGAWAGGKPPLDVELQVQHQLWVTGATWGGIATLVGGNELAPVLLRDPNPRVHSAFERELRTFWAEVEERRPPPHEGGRDNPVLLELLPVPEPGAPPLDATGDHVLAQACADLETARTMLRQAKAVAEAAEAVILAARAPEIITASHRVRVTKTPMDEQQTTRKAHLRKKITLKPHPEGVIYDAPPVPEYRV